MASELWRDKTLGIIGGGNMAEALVRGVLAAGLIPPGRITVDDPLPERRRIFADLGCRDSSDIAAALSANVVLLSVKPQVIRNVLRDMAGALRPGTLVISIAAGINIATLEEVLPPGVGVVRVMPNTPLLVGEGVSALAAGKSAGAAELKLAIELFSCSGSAYPVAESMLDAVTALSGSGPAYLFRFAEALIDGGVKLGLDPELAKSLVIGTLKGSADMLDKYREPALLRQRVTSPGGTTEAALTAFEQRDFSGIVRGALDAAYIRSIKLGRGE